MSERTYSSPEVAKRVNSRRTLTIHIPTELFYMVKELVDIDEAYRNQSAVGQTALQQLVEGHPQYEHLADTAVRRVEHLHEAEAARAEYQATQGPVA